MNDTMSFGECLNELLLLRGWSASRLAREINVDGSYIGKWIRGERIPSLKTDYVHQIAQSISLGIDLNCKTSTIDYFIEGLKYIGITLTNDKTLTQLIEDRLVNTQIYSLTLKPKARKKNLLSNEKEIHSLLERMENNTNCIQPIAEKNTFISELVDIPYYIEGREAVLRAAISILNTAINTETTNDKEIIITYQSEIYFFDGYPEIYNTWKSLITEALNKGWHINFLYRLNRNTSRSLNIVSEIFEWTGYKDEFLPCFFNKYGVISPSTEIIVIKEVGSLLCFEADGNGCIDRAFFCRQIDGIQAVYEHALRLNKETSPLFKILPAGNDYFKYSVEKDRQPGDFFVFSSDLYFYTIPLSLWEKYLKRSLKDEKEVQLHLTRIGERLNIFNEDIRKYKAKCIIQQKSVEHMVKTGNYLYYTYYQIPEPEDILEHLNYTISMLKNNDNFEIALISENQAHTIPLVNWEVKGSHSVVMSPWYMKKSYTYQNFAINEETIASAFHDYYLDIWERIPPKNRDKKFIISWLEEQVQWFKTQLNHQFME